MGNCFSADHIGKDHKHTNIICDIEEPKHNYRLGTTSNKWLVLLDPNPPPLLYSAVFTSIDPREGFLISIHESTQEA